MAALLKILQPDESTGEPSDISVLWCDERDDPGMQEMLMTPSIFIGKLGGMFSMCPLVLGCLCRGGPHNVYELQGRVRSIPVQCDVNPGQLPNSR